MLAQPCSVSLQLHCFPVKPTQLPNPNHRLAGPTVLKLSRSPRGPKSGCPMLRRVIPRAHFCGQVCICWAAWRFPCPCHRPQDTELRTKKGRFITMRAPSSAKTTCAGSEHDASLSSLRSSAPCIGLCVTVCRARTSCSALCTFLVVCLRSRLAFSELIRTRFELGARPLNPEGRPCTGLYPCVPWMRKPEANDANCPSWAQKPRGEGEREGGKGRGASAHVADTPLRNGKERAAAGMTTCILLSPRNQLASFIQWEMGHS